jgi:hypothetical protein
MLLHFLASVISVLVTSPCVPATQLFNYVAFQDRNITDCLSIRK